MVKRHKVLHQRQANAHAIGVEAAVLAFVEPLEERRQLVGGNARAIVLHTDDGPLAVVTGERHLDVAILTIILRGVRNEVVEYLVELVAIKVAHNVFGLAIYRQPDVLFVRDGHDALHLIAHKIAHRALRHPQVLVARLGLTELQDLLQQAHQAVHVAIDGSAIVLRLGVGLHQLADSGRYDGERRHQVVGDIGEELQLLVVQLFNVMALHVCQLQLAVHFFLVLEIAHHHVDGTPHQDHIDHPRIPAQVEGRQHMDVYNLLVGAPVARCVGMAQAEGIASRCQITIHHLALTGVGIHPIVVVALQSVRETRTGLTVVVERGIP